ncbi:MAG: S-methyl-5-thioribose-1-phosphate isomerase [Phycisphaeraceae bacterium]|nr:S-methyl-5-thioribose-1-phosphate isomerase [Phycisphaeraceae bacterium]
MVTPALRWMGDSNGYLELIDQRCLPGTLDKLDVRDTVTLHDAIKTLAVRGAPAIGVAAAYGLVLAGQTSSSTAASQMFVDVKAQAEYLAQSRPTAVNLFWALDRVTQAAERFVQDHPSEDCDALLDCLFQEAQAICQEDVDMCLAIGQNGQGFIQDGFGVLTHCNAGALATAGQGTALSLMFEAQKQGKDFTVYADETRPLLQGARLTAWELQNAGVSVKLICDNMAGWLMKQGLINMVVTGADRIAANGDSANKIGTYSLSLLAKAHGIPFYIAAPSSTFDLSLASGDVIPIEERDAHEVTQVREAVIAPKDIGTRNPAFDVAPAENITAIITEIGVIENPTKDKIAAHFK